MRSTSSLRATWRGATPYLFIAPFFISFGIFGIFALIRGFGYSLTDQTGLRPGANVGLHNYLELLGDATFRAALLRTIVLTLLVVPVLSFGALAVAWLLRSPVVKFQRTLRSILLVPVLPSLVVVGIAFLLLLDPEFGLVSRVLTQVGLNPIELSRNSAAALPVLAAMTCWRYLGYNVIIHLAAVLAVPRETEEAARMDGVNFWSWYWHILVPSCRGSLVFTAVLSTIGVFNMFEESYVLYGTQGGPDGAGLILGVLIYRTGFVDFKLGYASAMAFVVCLIVLALTAVQLRARRHGE